jgi:hypothetical protein
MNTPQPVRTTIYECVEILPSEDQRERTNSRNLISLAGSVDVFSTYFGDETQSVFNLARSSRLNAGTSF